MVRDKEVRAKIEKEEAKLSFLAGDTIIILEKARKL